MNENVNPTQEEQYEVPCFCDDNTTTFYQNHGCCEYCHFF
jgi:hypothetical protein